ncbi:MAG: hypothetical protein EXR75_12055 [Myxococcales bacterium]|nr:hypothetical protein [Myxococcales bacterium]
MLKKRTLLTALTAFFAAATVVWMQGRFEAADERSALALVQEYRSKTGAGLPQLIAHRHAQRPITWSTATESACFQHIRVHAVVDEPGPSAPVLYAFTVDINGPVLHPANEATRDLMKQLDEAPPSSGGGQ